MKKLLFLGLLTAALTASAQSDSVTTRTTRTITTTHTHKYYYYPSSNVYYDPSTDNYVYDEAPSKTWVRVKALPSNVVLDTTGSRVIYYKGEDVWVENPIHVKKYKVTRKGVKMKPVKH